MSHILRVLACLLFLHSAFSAWAISVSGVVTTTDGSSPAGFHIVVEQVGGELPLFHADTAANGTFTVSDPLLFGNVRITATRAGYQLSPAEINRFTSSNITDANFSAAPLVPDVSVLAPGGASLVSGGTFTLPAEFPGYTRALAFTLRNDGLTPLTNLSASFTGTDAAEFALLNAPPASLAPNATTTLTVLWMPASDGLRSATLQLASNDPDEANFVVHLAGEVLPLSLLTVSNNADDGTGSLRAALAQAIAAGGARQLLVAPALSGGTITLQTQLLIGSVNDISLDASTLPGGLTVQGNTNLGSASPRLFRVSLGGRLQLTGLTLASGQGSGEDRGGILRNEGHATLTRCNLTNGRVILFQVDTAGGAIANAGTLQLFRCRLTNNLAEFGAALFNDGLAELTDCTLQFNGSGFTEAGGGIASTGRLSLTRCTVANNSCRTTGGGLVLSGDSTLTACTIDRNRTITSGSSGGGIYAISGQVVLSHCTVTNNSAETGGGLVQVATVPATGTTRFDHSIFHGNVGLGGDIRGGPFFSSSANIVGTTTSPVTGPLPFAVDPLLAPLDDYGGPTPTRATQPGSPARGATTGSLAVTDQRGFPIVGQADLGAYEAGTLAPNFNAYIWETLPASATAPQHAAAFDFDGDGQSNFSEWLAQTDAASSRSFFRATAIDQSGQLAIEFASAVGRTYRLEQCNALDSGSFVPVPDAPPLAGTGAVLRFLRPRDTPRAFFRVVAQP